MPELENVSKKDSQACASLSMITYRSEISNALVCKSRRAHNFNRGKGRPAHAVAHHLKKREFLQGIRLDMHIAGVDLGSDFRNALTDVEGRVALGGANALDHIGKCFLKHGYEQIAWLVRSNETVSHCRVDEIYGLTFRQETMANLRMPRLFAE